jgi:hypothetical protein
MKPFEDTAHFAKIKRNIADLKKQIKRSARTMSQIAKGLSFLSQQSFINTLVDVVENRWDVDALDHLSYYGQLDKLHLNPIDFEVLLEDVLGGWLEERGGGWESPWEDDPDEAYDEAADELYRFEVAFDKAVAKAEKATKKPPKGAEDPRAALGMFAFANDRVDSGEVPPEPDTKVEKQLAKALDMHFDDNQRLGVKFSNMIKGYLKRNMYKDVLKKPPKGSVLYRGMGVSADWLAKFLKRETFPERGEVSGNFTFRPKTGAGSASWSDDPRIANDFSTGKDDVSVILHAKASSNPDSFVMGSGGLYKLVFAEHYSHEDEVIGLGAINVSKVAWEVESLATWRVELPKSQLSELIRTLNEKTIDRSFDTPYGLGMSNVTHVMWTAIAEAEKKRLFHKNQKKGKKMYWSFGELPEKLQREINARSMSFAWDQLEKLATKQQHRVSKKGKKK